MGSERPAENRISYLPARTAVSTPLVNFMKLAPRVISLFLARRAKSRVRTPFPLSPYNTPYRPLDEASSPIKTRSVCFSPNPRHFLFPSLLRFSSTPILPYRLSLSFSFSLPLFSTSAPRYIKLGAGEASDNRFNRWTVKEIAASTPSRSHNVKSTRKRERERESAI